MVLKIDKEKSEEKRNDMVHDLLENIFPKEIQKVNTFFKRIEEIYSKKHGEIKEKGKLLVRVFLFYSRKKQQLKSKRSN